MKTAADYYTISSEWFEDFPARGYTSIPVLEFLKGREWDDIALAFVHGLRPECIRVTRGEQTCDSRTWRVTVIINEDNIIEEITQEVSVGLPDGIDNGYELRRSISEG